MTNSPTTVPSTAEMNDALFDFRNFTQQDLSCREFFDILTERYYMSNPTSNSIETTEYKNAALNGLRPTIRRNLDGDESFLSTLSVADIRCRALQAEHCLAAEKDLPLHFGLSASEKSQPELPQPTGTSINPQKESHLVQRNWRLPPLQEVSSSRTPWQRELYVRMVS